MKAKFFHQLPDVLHRYVDTHLNSSDSSHLAQTARGFYALSNQPPLAMEQRKPLKKFLGHVVHGERESMQEMLRQNPQLLLQRDVVTDCSGRTFASISGFEYALWALDKFQWEDMLACLPLDNTGHLTEEGQKIATQLQQQYVHLKTNGVTYRLNDVTRTEFHYDFAIINALQEQENAQTASGEKNLNDLGKHWREGVGGAQRLCPMHVADEYCSNTPFYPLPQFDSRPTPVRGLRQFYNWISSSWEFWFAGESKLSIDFSLYKAGWMRCLLAKSHWGIEEAVALDLDAMTALCETRTLDFSVLETQLESLMDIEERPRAGF